MISFWCSSTNVTVCSTSTANLSVFSSLRVILATKTSGVFWNSYGNTEGGNPPLECLPVLGLARDKVGHQIPLEPLNNVGVEICLHRPSPPIEEHRILAFRRRDRRLARFEPGGRMNVP